MLLLFSALMCAGLDGRPLSVGSDLVWYRRRKPFSDGLRRGHTSHQIIPASQASGPPCPGRDVVPLRGRRETCRSCRARSQGVQPWCRGGPRRLDGRFRDGPGGRPAQPRVGRRVAGERHLQHPRY